MSKTLKIFNDLFQPFPEELQATKKQGGQEITFVEWHQYVLRAHRQFPDGYSKDVKVTSVQGRDKKGEPVSTLIVTVRITDVYTGAYQEALGAADAGKTSWGGAVAEAESQALRRAFANWGLGLDMYLDDDQFDIWTQGGSDDEDEEDDAGDEEEDDAGDDEEDGDGDEEEDEEDDDGETEASDRQLEVLSVVGTLLDEHATEDGDFGLELFLEDQRAILERGLTQKRCGAIINKFRRKLNELDLEDPTKRDED